MDLWRSRTPYEVSASRGHVGYVVIDGLQMLGADRGPNHVVMALPIKRLLLHPTFDFQGQNPIRLERVPAISRRLCDTDFAEVAARLHAVCHQKKETLRLAICEAKSQGIKTLDQDP
ncbi:uncharacterized protein LOC134201584 [Bombyx mori]|uniref:uncharacterized protein LOC134201584 n=1 Tax=Bombyx mori TaxID=7091 RepID=UPI002ED4F3E1